METKTFLFEAEQHQAKLKMYGRWPSGTIFRDESFSINVIGIQEFNATFSDTPTRIIRFDKNTTRFDLAQTVEYIPERNLRVDVFSNKIYPFPNNDVVFIDARASVANGSYTIMLAGREISVRQDALKLAVESKSFPFLNDTVKFALLINYEFTVPFSGASINWAYSPDGSMFNINVTTANLFAAMGLQAFGSIDGEFALFQSQQEPLPLRTAESWILEFFYGWPVFRNHFLYDPDFSILLTSPDPGLQPTAVDGSLRAADSAFQPWIVAVIVVCVVFMMLVIILVGFLLKRAVERRNQLVLRSALDRSGQLPHQEVKTIEISRSGDAQLSKPQDSWKAASKPTKL